MSRAAARSPASRAGDKRQRQRGASAQSAAAAPIYRARRYVVLTIFLLAVVALVGRAFERQILQRDFLQREGADRYLDEVSVPAHRGVITDRYGAALAVSTPVESLGANPRVMRQDTATLAPLAKVLGKGVDELRRRLARFGHKRFIFLARHLTPDEVEAVRKVAAEHDIEGLEFRREFRRFYPAGEVFAHVIGFAGADDRGQEGLELAHDRWLRGVPGEKRVLRDGRQQVVKDIESIREPRPGANLALSIDRRLQFIAYRELKAAVQKHQAKSGSLVMLDVQTGEILALVNQPAYNPNGGRNAGGGRLRNRALTDVFEPGSTMKPFAVAAALASGAIRPDAVVDTSPGLLKVGTARIEDPKNYGAIDLATVLRRSSNVGVAKIALGMDKERYWRVLGDLGFGADTATGFPGEVTGSLTYHGSWTPTDQASLAFGYGISVTAVQLAKAYAVIANNGLARPVSLVKQDEPLPARRVLPEWVSKQVRRMMEAVVSSEGTAPAAQVPRYRVAGKTGTVKVLGKHGYSDDSYVSVFAGMAPASNPRLVTVVMLREPSAGQFYGGQVAAPVFAKVMDDAMRLLNVPPDGDLSRQPMLAQARQPEDAQ